jgi:hypothetical protein
MLQVLLMILLPMEGSNKKLMVGYKFDKRIMKASTAITHTGSIKLINGSHVGMSFYLLLLHNC